MDVQQKVNRALASTRMVNIYVIFRHGMAVGEVVSRYRAAQRHMDEENEKKSVGLATRSLRLFKVYTEALVGQFTKYPHVEIAIPMKTMKVWGLDIGVERNVTRFSAKFAVISIMLNNSGVYIRRRDSLEKYDVVELPVRESHACFMSAYAMRMRDVPNDDGTKPATFYHRPALGVYIWPQVNPKNGWYCHALVAHLLRQAGFLSFVDIWCLDGEVLHSVLLDLCGGRALNVIEVGQMCVRLGTFNVDTGYTSGTTISIGSVETTICCDLVYQERDDIFM